MGDKIQQTFLNFSDMLVEMLPNLLVSIAFLIIFFILGKIVHNIYQRSAKRRQRDTIVTVFAGQAIKWAFYLTGLLFALHVLGFGSIANSLLAGAGVTAIVVGFAFKDIAENFLAGILLAVNRPFKKGNIIQIGEFKGTVKSMDLRTTHIRNKEGQDIFIPNAMIVKNVLVNYTLDGLLRLDFLLGFDVPTDVSAARNIILEYLQAQNEILKRPEPNVLTVEVGDFTTNVKVLFWVDVLKDKNIPPGYLGETIRSNILSDIKDLLLKNGFNFPSPVRELKMYNSESPITVSLNK